MAVPILAAIIKAKAFSDAIGGSQNPAPDMSQQLGGIVTQPPQGQGLLESLMAFKTAKAGRDMRQGNAPDQPQNQQLGDPSPLLSILSKFASGGQ